MHNGFSIPNNLGCTNDIFIKQGFSVDIKRNIVNFNGPVVISIKLREVNKFFALKLSKQILSHYHIPSSLNEKIVEDFFSDCVSELIAGGGVLPHVSIKDWLFFKGVRAENILF